MGREERIYTDPIEFFRRTLVTKYMVEVLEGITEALLGGGGNKVVMLLSLFGGGKTHTLLTIYHAFRNSKAVLEAKTEDGEVRERLSRLVEVISKLGSVRLIVIDGFFSELAPTPVNQLVTPSGYSVKTLWGSIAHQLGRYSEVRENDEKLIAPPADVVVKLLGDEPTLILVDELVDYIVRLETSGDPGLKSYATQVLSFTEHLAKAVDLSRRSVLVISLPVEERREGPLIEELYRPSKDAIISLYDSIGRVAAKRITPVAPPDIPSILRVRLFQDVDERVAKAVSSTLERIYGSEENRMIFGEGAVREAHTVLKTYPFHPTYITTLINIVDKHEGLQKTRDAIRITRKVLRKLYSGKSTSELVMPFHIDVEDHEIGAILFSHELYRQYGVIVEEDIVERTKGYEKPELARVIAKTIMVRTFVYAGSTRYHQLYPDKHEVILSSFEPSMARAFNLQPSDYLTALEWISNNLAYLVSEGNRYWFIQFASPVKMVEMRARTIDDYMALEKVKEYAGKLLSKPYEEVVSGSRRREQRRMAEIPFNIASSMILREPKPVDLDSRDYVLLVVLSPLRASDIEKMIYRTGSGGLRRYANTIYLVYPRDGKVMAQMLGLAKLLLACNMVAEELDSIYTDSEIRDVMRRKLDKYCKGMDGVEGKLVINILAGLNTVAYPSYDERRLQNTFKETSATMADTIVEIAVKTLSSERPPKYYEELDFEQLEYMLSQIGIQISSGEATRTVSDVIDFFYSNPRLPMVTEKTIKKALLDGVRRLHIGVRSSGRIYFKRVYNCTSRQECKPPTIEEGEVPQDLTYSDILLPWRIALLEQLEGLKEVREEKVRGGIRRVWHAFYIEGDLVPIAKAMEKFELDTLRYAPIIRVTEFLEEGVDVKLDKYEIHTTPGEEVAVNVILERIGSFKGDLRLAASTGLLSSEALSISDERPSAVIEWRIRAPEEPGTYNYEFKVMNSTGETLRTVGVTLIVKPRRHEFVKGVPPKGTKVSLIEVEVSGLNLKPVNIIASKLRDNVDVEEAVLELEAEIAGRRSRVFVKLNDVATDDLKSLFSAIVQRYGIATRRLQYKVRLKPRGADYVVAPEFSGDELRDLENFMKYYVFEGA